VLAVEKQTLEKLPLRKEERKERSRKKLNNSLMRSRKQEKKMRSQKSKLALEVTRIEKRLNL